MLRPANRKKAILKTTIPAFLELYKNLVKINFTQNDGIKELSDFPVQITEEMSIQVRAVGQITTDSEAVVYLVAIGIFNFLGASFAIKKEAKDKQEEADQIAKQSRLQAAQFDNIALSYSAIEQRCSKMTDVITKLNILFKKNID